MKKTVLFVCKHNIFRSRIAEYYMDKTKFNVSSGGLFAPGGKLHPMQEKVINKLGIVLSESTPISFTTLRNTDILIIVADDVPSSLFDSVLYGEMEIINWIIPDVLNGEQKDIEKTIKLIEKKVGGLEDEIM